MKYLKFGLLIPMICFTVLLSSCGSVNSSLQITNKNNFDSNTDILFHCYSYGLDYSSDSYFYTNNKLINSNNNTFNGFYNSVSLTALQPIYNELNINSDDYEKLTDVLGQYYFYDHYEDAEVFTFYNNYFGEPYNLNIVINKDGKITTLTDSYTVENNLFPLFTYREKEFYYILCPWETNFAEGEYNYSLYKVNLDTITFDEYHFTISDIPYNFNQLDWVIVDETMIYGLSEFELKKIDDDTNEVIDLPDAIYTLDTKSESPIPLRHQLDSKNDNISNIEFLLRDENTLLFGQIQSSHNENAKDSLIINKHLLSDGSKETISIPLDMTDSVINQSSYFRDGLLYLYMTESISSSPKDVIAIINVKEKATSDILTINLDKKYTGVRIRFINVLNDAYYSAPYTSCR